MLILVVHFFIIILLFCISRYFKSDAMRSNILCGSRILFGSAFGYPLLKKIIEQNCIRRWYLGAVLAIRAGRASQVGFCTVSVHDQTVVEKIRAWFITVGFIFGTHVTHVRLTKLVHSPAHKLSITRLKKNHKSDARLPPPACVCRLFVKKKRHIQQTYLINK